MNCPKCGAKGTLIYGRVYQVCYEHHICRDGKISNKSKKTPEFSEDWHYVSCLNCGMHMTGHDDNTYEVKNNKIVFESEDTE